MIKAGQKKRARYWGTYTVEKIARLKKPVECYSEDVGTALFNPTLVKIRWGTAPSDDMHEFWFPYWITTAGKEKYGQFAPMMGESSFLELLEDAIEQDFFSANFLHCLKAAVSRKLHSK